jgi:hypothetical protein
MEALGQVQRSFAFMGDYRTKAILPKDFRSRISD